MMAMNVVTLCPYYLKYQKEINLSTAWAKSCEVTDKTDEKCKVTDKICHWPWVISGAHSRKGKLSHVQEVNKSPVKIQQLFWLWNPLSNLQSYNLIPIKPLNHKHNWNLQLHLYSDVPLGHQAQNTEPLPLNLIQPYILG